MDSGNSGSLQSSSGGDDQEYADSSCFPSFHFINPIPIPIPIPHPSSTTLVVSSQSHQPTPTHHIPFLNQTPNYVPQPDPIHSDPAPKNPKKRTRASRRAPTTVLTTDTSNFRQMVQEFTGIPTAPFASRRFDLFGSSAASLRPSPLGNYNSAFSQTLLNMPFNQPSLGLAAASTSKWRSGEGESDQQSLRNMSYGAGSSQRVLKGNTCNFNYSATSSEFLQHERPLENLVISRGEATHVQSWISPSD